MRFRRGDHPLHFREVDREIGLSLAFDQRGSGDARDVAVQLIGRLEGRHRASGAGEGEEDRLEDFVAAVGHENHRGRHTMEFADGGPQSTGRTIRIPIPLNRIDGRCKFASEVGWRTDRCLVRVQADANIDLWRVIALEDRQIVTHGNPDHTPTLPM